MLRKIFAFVLCWGLCATLAAETSKIDSLEAQQVHLKAMSSFKSNNLERAEVHIQLSYEYRGVDTTKCRMNALEALKLTQNVGSIEGEAYFALARYYYIADIPYMSYVNYKEAEKIFSKYKDKENLFKVYRNLMILFNNIEDKKNTAIYARKVQDMIAERSKLEGRSEREKEEDQSIGISAEFILGWAELEDDAGPEALDFYLKMYQKSIDSDDHLNANIIASNCGGLFVEQNRLREALQFLHFSRNSFETGGMIVMAETYGLLAEAYAMLGKIDSAQYYIKKARNSPLYTDETRKILLRSYSVLEASTGNYRGALANFKQYHQVSDSINKIRRMDEIGRMKNWQADEKRDNDNENLKRDQERQKKYTIALSILLTLILILLGLAIFLYRKTHENNKELKQLHTVKDKLFSVVAHDLRGPMGALVSMLKMASNNMLNAEMQAQLLKDITNRVDDTYSLLDNLLRWSKSQMQGMVLAPVYFNAQEGSRSVTDTLQGIAATKKITLVNHIDNYRIFADKDMFAVLIRNLTTNALKYTSAEGQVILDAKMSDNMLVISVTDTGTGMPQEVQDKLFKLSETKSKRGTNNESGTGLGLVLCADFVKANGGKIWFSSEQGKGSTFYFSIPVKEQRS